MNLVDVASVFETGFFFLERVDLNSTLARPAYHPITKAEFARIRQMTMMQIDALIYGEEYNEVVF